MIEVMAGYGPVMTSTNTIDPTTRCRLVLILQEHEIVSLSNSELQRIITAGDVASVLFSAPNMEESIFQNAVEPLVEVTQSSEIAAIVEFHTRAAGRVGADGLQLGQDPDALEDAIDNYSPKLMVGAGNVKTRHNALVIGELQPDYLMFGKPGGDIRPEPHPKNIDLGGWWSSMVEIPCIVLGGNDHKSVVDVANTGAEFVALAAAIFAPDKGAIDVEAAAAQIKEVNRLLNDHAPRFETSDE